MQDIKSCLLKCIHKFCTTFPGLIIIPCSLGFCLNESFYSVFSCRRISKDVTYLTKRKVDLITLLVIKKINFLLLNPHTKHLLFPTAFFSSSCSFPANSLLLFYVWALIIRSDDVNTLAASFIHQLSKCIRFW